MTDNVTVIVAHRLGKLEAIRRIREGLARSDGHLGSMIVLPMLRKEAGQLLEKK